LIVELSAYLDRIGFEGRPAADRATLEAVQRLHLLAIPYENLDVQLGRPLTTSPAAAFDKLVTRRRGGWCYEMNGVLGWALAEIGFRVTRLTGAVMRSVAGDASIGNHLVLRIDMEGGPRLADVGLGDGPFTPYPMMEGSFTDRGLDFRLERVEGGWWRLHNHALARPPNFDLHLEREDEGLLARKCAVLQSDPASLFVQNLICQRFTPDGHVDLIGRVLRRYGPGGTSEQILESAAELIEALGDMFGLIEPAAAGLWPRICERHEVVFSQASSSMSQ
jgi:N-hydroxyarylamine O-acetyltransferase